jgi:hypothetical protein
MCQLPKADQLYDELLAELKREGLIGKRNHMNYHLAADAELEVSDASLPQLASCLRDW